MNRLRQYIEQISPLQQATWDRLAPLFQPRLLRKNDYFALAGRVESTAAYVVEGVLRAFYRQANGLEYNKTFFVEDDFMGAFSSLVTEQTNQIYIQALTPCQLFVADYPILRQLYDAHPDWERFARRLAESYFVFKERRELDLALLNAEERYEQFQRDFPGLQQRIPQYHVASYLAVTPTQLSRIRRTRAGR